MKKDIEAIKVQIELSKIGIDNYDKNAQIKSRIHQSMNATVKSKDFKNQLTMGDILTLYMSLLREVEMKELYENSSIYDDVILPTEHTGFGKTV